MRMEDLISKRELLERYGVSYGALYRWKRMGLIPEDWFLRRATPTGQETFFHRAQICPRVEQILQRGETSLEELAEKLREPEHCRVSHRRSPSTRRLALTRTSPYSPPSKRVEPEQFKFCFISDELPSALAGAPAPARPRSM